MITISLIKKDQSEQVHRLRDYSFSSTYIGERKNDFQYWIEHSTTIGAFDQSKLVGQLLVLPLNMTIHDRNYDMGGLGFVATYPEYRNQGIMKNLMQRALEEMRKNGQVISVLAPFSVSFYRYFGWELFCDKVKYTIPSVAFPMFGNVKDDMRRFNFQWFDQKIFSDIQNFHNEQALDGTGGMIRDSAWWKRIERREPESHFAAIYEKEKITGYFRYIIKDLTFYIQDFVSKNIQADQAIWRFVTAHAASISEIKGVTANHHHFGFSFKEPQFQKELISDVMLRIVDVENFLKNYSWYQLTSPLYVQIEDCFTTWNEKTFCINEDAEVKVVESHLIPKEEIVVLPINIFSSMMVGYLTVSESMYYAKEKVNFKTIEMWEQALRKSTPMFNEYF